MFSSVDLKHSFYIRFRFSGMRKEKKRVYKNKFDNYYRQLPRLKINLHDDKKPWHFRSFQFVKRNNFANSWHGNQARWKSGGSIEMDVKRIGVMRFPTAWSIGERLRNYLSMSTRILRFNGALYVHRAWLYLACISARKIRFVGFKATIVIGEHRGYDSSTRDCSRDYEITVFNVVAVIFFVESRGQDTERSPLIGSSLSSRHPVLDQSNDSFIRYRVVPWSSIFVAKSPSLHDR